MACAFFCPRDLLKLLCSVKAFVIRMGFNLANNVSIRRIYRSNFLFDDFMKSSLCLSG